MVVQHLIYNLISGITTVKKINIILKKIKGNAFQKLLQEILKIRIFSKYLKLSQLTLKVLNIQQHCCFDLFYFQTHFCVFIF